MFDTLKRSEYKVVRNGALPFVTRPRIERSIEQVLNADIQTTKEKNFGRNVTTKKTRIA
jgi:hypothetical protein